MESLKCRYLTLLLAMLTSVAAFADGFTLKGKVIDEEERALELVTVSCLAQGKVTMTNLKGEFSLDLQSADSVEVRFSMVGYGVRKRIFRRPKGRMTVRIVMHPMEALQEITVTERRRQTTDTAARHQGPPTDALDDGERRRGTHSATGGCEHSQRTLISI